jgi:hypothetical protein
MRQCQRFFLERSNATHCERAVAALRFADRNFGEYTHKVGRTPEGAALLRFWPVERQTSGRKHRNIADTGGQTLDLAGDNRCASSNVNGVQRVAD